MKRTSSPKLTQAVDQDGKHVAYYHWCPECKFLHPLPDDRWKFNGSFESPTFEPSFRQHVGIRGEGATTDCHYFVKNGRIEWCGDSYHMKTGTEDLPDIPEEELNDWCGPK